MLRRSMLFIPLSSPRMIQNADVFESDSIILDLEDAVSLSEKDGARDLLKNALDKLSFNCEKVVRVNPTDSAYFEEDMKVVKKLKIDLILLPKADKKSIALTIKKLGESKIKIMALIESALGVEEAFDVVKHKQVVGVLLGGEDLATNLGVKRTKSSTEILYARQRVVNACAVFGKSCIDTPFTDTEDQEGLIADTQFAKSIGFTGKAAINPRQVVDINNGFNPTNDEIKYATKVLDAAKEATKKGLGVFSVDGKMVDLPIINRAKQVMEKAKKAGLV